MRDGRMFLGTNTGAPNDFLRGAMDLLVVLSCNHKKPGVFPLFGISEFPPKLNCFVPEK